jgi:hypothetical protein
MLDPHYLPPSHAARRGQGTGAGDAASALGGRAVQTTSPSMRPLPSGGATGLDEWDIQLAGTMLKMEAGQGAPRRASTHATPAALHAPPAPSVARFAKEQMIRAAVSALMAYGITVSPGLLDFRNRSDAQLDETMAVINQALADSSQHGAGGVFAAAAASPAPQGQGATPGGSAPRSSAQALHGAQPQQPRFSTLDREIYFDLHLQSDARDRVAQPARPHAPIGHARTPLVLGQLNPGQQQQQQQQHSHSAVRFSTPAQMTASLHAPMHDDSGALASPAPQAQGFPGPAAFAVLGSPSLHGSAPAVTAAAVVAASAQRNSATVKPNPRPYDPKMIPRDLYERVSIASSRRRIAPSASSAFSQHSSSSTMTQKDPRSSEDVFVRFGS